MIAAISVASSYPVLRRAALTLIGQGERGQVGSPYAAECVSQAVVIHHGDLSPVVAVIYQLVDGVLDVQAVWCEIESAGCGQPVAACQRLVVASHEDWRHPHWPPVGCPHISYHLCELRRGCDPVLGCRCRHLGCLLPGLRRAACRRLCLSCVPVSARP